MSWRYQPVWIMSHDEKLHILIEVFFFFDNAGKLDSWTLYEENRRYEPSGDTQEELIEDLEIKLRDAMKWEAVEYDKIEVGMKFEERLTAEDIEIINFVTENNQLLKNLKQKDDEGKI